MFSFVYTFLKKWFDHSTSGRTTLKRKIRKLHLKLYLKRLHLEYMLNFETVTKGS